MTERLDPRGPNKFTPPKPPPPPPGRPDHGSPGEKTGRQKGK